MLLPPLVRFGLGAGFGAILGSYLATVAIRMPQGGSANRGRSQCDQCHQPLRASDLVPLLSYLGQRGRCRHCGAKIDPLHFIVELAGAMICGVAALMATSLMQVGAALLFGLVLLLLAALDGRHFWLPNPLTALLALGGLIAGEALFGASLTDRLIGGVAGFASLYAIAFLYRSLRQREGMGGGDPKLLGAIGLWTGWVPLPFITLGAALLGLGYALTTPKKSAETPASLTALPFGAFMAVAAIAYMLIVLAGW